MCFLRNGIAGTTIEAICTESGASVGSVYHFFQGKERLAVELHIQTLRNYFDAYLGALLPCRTARTGIQAAVRAHLRWVVDQEPEARYMFQCQEIDVDETARLAIAQLREQFYSQASAWLAPHVRNGHVKALSPRLCQALWMGPSVEYGRLWLAGAGAEFKLLDAQRDLAAAAWEALRAPTGPT